MSCGIGAAGVADAITGRVVNSNSNGLANTKVWLKNNPSISDSTDNDGKFSLELGSTKVISGHAAAMRVVTMGMAITAKLQIHFIPI